LAHWAAGAAKHPAFPAPSALSRVVDAKLGRFTPREGEGLPTVPARSQSLSAQLTNAGLIRTLAPI